MRIGKRFWHLLIPVASCFLSTKVRTFLFPKIRVKDSIPATSALHFWEYTSSSPWQKENDIMRLLEVMENAQLDPNLACLVLTLPIR